MIFMSDSFFFNLSPVLCNWCQPPVNWPPHSLRFSAHPLILRGSCSTSLLHQTVRSPKCIKFKKSLWFNSTFLSFLFWPLPLSCCRFVSARHDFPPVWTSSWHLAVRASPSHQHFWHPPRGPQLPLPWTRDRRLQGGAGAAASPGPVLQGRQRWSDALVFWGGRRRLTWTSVAMRKTCVYFSDQRRSSSWSSL